MERIVPLTSSLVHGPLGIAHLPRLWLKSVLAAADLLPAGYRTGYDGTDAIMLDAIGVAGDPAFAYLATLPPYTAFERWIGDHASALDPASVAASNAAIAGNQKAVESAAAVRAFVGLDDANERGAAFLNALDDWMTVYVAVTAAGRGTCAPIVPAISSQSRGPLGVGHLPRFWLKATLNARGALYDGWRSGRPSGFDMWFTGEIGLDVDAAIAYVEAELPPYLVFEAWVAQRAQNLDAAAIERTNATLAVREKPEAVAAVERVELGIDDPNYRRSCEMNDLIDWKTLHGIAFERARARSATR